MGASDGSLGEREIVIAIVTPIGTPVEYVTSELSSAFEAFGYDSSIIRVSELLDTTLPTPPGEDEHSRYRLLMNKGDKFREAVEDDAACAYLAAMAIRAERKDKTGSVRQHRSRHVVLLRSLKTPHEVEVLRSIFGERLIVVGVSAPEDLRRRNLVERLSLTCGSAKASSEAGYLMTRDEKDEGESFGQRMRDAHRLADAFVPVGTPGSLRPVVSRLVGLLLGSPWITPLPDEQGMFYAWAAKFRSSAAGRQVGAAIVDDLGEVVATGCNDVPKPLGGQYWPGDDPDRRDFQLGHDANDRGKFDMATRMLQQLATDGWLSDSYRAMQAEDRAELALGRGGPLESSGLSDLIEFGRIVHAEMAALLTAAREGRSVRGHSMYTTTYPCHECARLIIAAGIARVVYIDPYQKSRAPEMYRDMFGGAPGTDRVAVVPFEGISPRLFHRAFELKNRSKGVRGEYEDWAKRRLITLNEELSDTIPAQEEAAGAYLIAKLPEGLVIHGVQGRAPLVRRSSSRRPLRPTIGAGRRLQSRCRRS